MPLVVAGHVGAAEEVKQVLFDYYPGAVAEKRLYGVVMWGAAAVRSVLETQPEVSTVCCLCGEGCGREG